MSNIGNGYLGSSKLETSTENQEIVPNPNEDWSYGYKFYKFSFMNSNPCTISINYGDDIYLQANQGFAMDRGDKLIQSFVIREADISYNWIAAY